MRLAFALLLLSGCFSGPLAPPAEPEPTRLQVATLSVPVDWMVRRIGGTAIDVTLAVPADADPQHHQPSGDEIARLAEADLIVYNGAGFEAWVNTATLPKSKMLDSAMDLDLIKIEGQTHSHGASEAEHSHAGTDPHTWVDAASFLLQGREIQAALIQAKPSERDQFIRGFSSVESSLARLDAELIASLEPMRTQRMAANHPAYNYMARRAGVDIKSFDFEPDKKPTGRQLGAFARWRGALAHPVLLWESAPTDEVKAAFPSQVRHLVIDPLENPHGDQYDYIKQYKANVDVFRKEFLKTE